jgi:hypothetical protein
MPFYWATIEKIPKGILTRFTKHASNFYGQGEKRRMEFL